MLGILMILATVALVVVAAVVLVQARLAQRPVPWRPLGLGAAAWAALYGALLLGASLTSQELVLGTEQDKKFCGFYIDCHMRVAVTRVDTLRELGLRKANGVFYVVTLRVSSDAVRARLNLIQPRLVLRDDRGRRYDHVPHTADVAALTRPIGPEESFTTTVVFDVPERAAGLRLQVSAGFWIDRLIEAVLIGDEDSLLHKHTTFAITA